MITVPLVMLHRQKTWKKKKSKEKKRYKANSSNVSCLETASNSCWQKVYSPPQRSQLGDFLLPLRHKYHVNSLKLLGN